MADKSRCRMHHQLQPRAQSQSAVEQVAQLKWINCCSVSLGFCLTDIFLEAGARETYKMLESDLLYASFSLCSYNGVKALNCI